jgi:hypothetical protein
MSVKRVRTQSPLSQKKDELVTTRQEMNIRIKTNVIKIHSFMADATHADGHTDTEHFEKRI